MEWLWFFYLYSALSFGLEVAFAKGMGLPKQDRKCALLLPVCPVYGLGMTAILSWIPSAGALGPVPMAAVGMVATAAEYAMGWFYETAWGVRFWDYRGLPGSIQGRVCLPFGICWGVLGTAVVRWVHPLAERLVRDLPAELLIPVTLVFLTDGVVTGHLLRRTGTTQVLRWYQPESMGF